MKVEIGERSWGVVPIQSSPHCLWFEICNAKTLRYSWLDADGSVLPKVGNFEDA